MVKQPIFPNDVLREWSKVKNLGVSDVLKLTKANYKQTGKVVLPELTVAWAELLKLYPKFDQGLRAAIGKANTAQTNAAALTALREVDRICDEYEKTVTKWRAKSEARNVVAGPINIALRAISAQCTKAMNAIQPAAMPTLVTQQPPSPRTRT